MQKLVQSINFLQNEFLQEASNAPKLFKDLAKVEQYIDGSYKTRSFIELIQNADDAEATTFGVHGVDQATRESVKNTKAHYQDKQEVDSEV
jgi:hypothetical protein